MSIFQVKHKKIVFLVSGIFLVAIFLVYSAYFSLRPNDKLLVSFFDVGQGDSSFIETPNHRQILIDGGPDSSVLSKLGRAMPFYDRSIDILIITHPDSDHLAGAVEVMKNYDIGLVLTNGRDCATKICAEFDKIAKEKNIKITAAHAGQKIDFGNNVIMDIFLPAEAKAKADSTSLTVNKNEDNNFSVISRLDYGADSFLFMGDAEAKEEIDLLDFWPNAAAEVLKVGHHGSKNSSNQLFLDKIKPKFSILSAGAKNRYGHPTIETLEKLKNIGSEIFRTDLGGDVVMVSKGEGVMLNLK